MIKKTKFKKCIFFSIFLIFLFSSLGRAENTETQSMNIYPTILQQASNQAVETPRKFYIKGIFGAGYGFEEVYLYMWLVKEGGEEGSDIYVRSGGGLNLEAALGYHILQNLMVEIGIGYQVTPNNPKGVGGKGWFKRIPLQLTLLYEFPTQSSLQFYIGGGGGIYLGPELFRELTGSIDASVYYDPPIGFHGLAGIKFIPKKKKSFYFFLETELNLGIKYKWNDSNVIPFTDWLEFGGNQILFNFGIVYYL